MSFFTTAISMVLISLKAYILGGFPGCVCVCVCGDLMEKNKQVCIFTE